jgi:tRNA(Ile)-lysidine synthase
MKTKALRLVSEYNMLKKGDRVLVGLSGGADSVALLLFLKEYSESVPIEVSACHINHGLRGKEAERDEKFCVELCKKLSVKLSVFHLSIAAVAKERGISEELAGREERYRIFSQVASETGALIAVAHNSDDLSETVIFNMIRGSALSGICSLKPVRDNIIRPLLSSSREDIERYLSEKGQSFITDSTNLSDDYTRNKIRHRIIPELKEINAKTLEHIYSLSMSASEDDLYLDAEAEKVFSESYNNGVLNAEVLGLHPAIKKRVVMRFLSENGCEKSRFNIDEICSLSQEKRKVNLSGNLFFELNDKGICLAENSVGEKLMKTLLTFGENDVSGMKITLSSVDLKDKKGYNKSYGFDKTAVAVDKAKTEGNIFVRGREEGDYLRPFGRGVGKSLKKLFIEEKIPAHRRESIPVFADDNGIIGVFSFGADKRVAPDENTKEILVIQTEIK